MQTLQNSCVRNVRLLRATFWKSVESTNDKDGLEGEPPGPSENNAEWSFEEADGTADFDGGESKHIVEDVEENETTGPSEVKAELGFETDGACSVDDDGSLENSKDYAR